MALKLTKFSSERVTYDLVDDLYPDGPEEALPFAIFFRYGVRNILGQQGIWSFASQTGTGSYIGSYMHATTGRPNVWARGASGTDYDPTLMPNIEGDGKMHSTLMSFRERSAGLSRSRIVWDGGVASVDENNNGTISLTTDLTEVSFGLSDGATTLGDYGHVQVLEFAAWRGKGSDLGIAEAYQMHHLRKSALWIQPQDLIAYCNFEQMPPRDMITGKYWTYTSSGTIKLINYPANILSYPPGYYQRQGFLVNPTDLAEGHLLRRKRYGKAGAVAAGGRIMSSLAHHGGLAGVGGIAGPGGGLAG